jgi:isopenicillin N synthase-like dioxygenase
MLDVDVNDLRTTDPARRRDAVATIERAGRGCGAFALQNHGLDEALVARAFAMTQALYALPLETRMRYRAEGDNLRGYQPLPRSSGDLREKFLVTTAVGPRDPAARSVMPGDNRWPAEVPAFREAVEACQRALTALGRTALCGIAEALGLAPTAFDDAFDAPGGSCLWLLHYPAAPWVRGEPAQGASAHTDLHPLALIVQDDQQALEVLSDGAWIAPDPARQRIVCQMGDMIARWSNEVFHPNVHRVRSPASRSRYSLALFMQPALDAVIAPVPSCVSAERPARFAPQTFGACLTEWFRALDEGRAGSVPGV